VALPVFGAVAVRRAVNINRISRVAMTALVSGGLSLAGFGLAEGTAQAKPWPGCETNSGPCHWCPGGEASAHR
jgi:hypothetical protein